MEVFEITVKRETFKVSRKNPENALFSVFNHATFHIIYKHNSGKWESIEHRFGLDKLPVKEIGDAIDKHYPTDVRQPRAVRNKQISA